MAKNQMRDSFDAIVADHKNSRHYFEETDGTWRTWRDLSPEAKLSYIARDAVLDGVSPERFASAVRDVLGELPVAAREEAALRQVLESQRQLHQLAALLPPDDRTESVPLVDRFEEVLAWYAGRAEQTEIPVTNPPQSLSGPGMGGENSPREQLVDLLSFDFFLLEQQAVLAGEEVPRDALAADIRRVERQVLKLADALFAAGGEDAARAAGYASPFLKGQKDVAREDQGIER
jgi:hypothetical protein